MPEANTTIQDSPPPSEEPMIRFTCRCGKLLQAREEHAGRRVACPACGQAQVVPGEDTAVQPDASAPPPRGQERVQERPGRGREEDEFEDRPRRERRRRDEFEEEGREPARAEEGPATSGKALTGLILGVLSVVCGCAFLTGLPGLLLSYLALGDIKRSRGRLGGKGLALTGLIASGVGTVLCTAVMGVGGWFGYQRVGDASRRMSSSNNLKQIGLAFHNYHDVRGSLPLQGFSGRGEMPRPGEKPNLSWRVALLPYLAQENLYRQFRLDEPWDSPHNKALIAQMPKVYKLPGVSTPQPGLTFYQVFAGRLTAFDGQPKRLANITDGTSNTILVVEAAKPVIWTKPEDLDFDRNGPLPPLGGHFLGGFQVLLMDGSVRQLPQDTPTQTLRLLIMPSDGQPVPFPR
jgi:hypothetical protein